MASVDAEPLTAEGSGWRVARDRSAAVDRAITELVAFDDREEMALAGVGGYGRSQLAPGSDVDILMLCLPDLRGEAKDAFEALLYALWDAGLRVGHALRTPQECEADASAELFTLTSLLSIRWLAGSKGLVKGIRDRAHELLRETDFLDGLRASRIEREARAGRVAEAQSPDLRDGLGGLRDLHVIEWVRLRAPDEGPRQSQVRPPDLTPFTEIGDFLWRARIALHRATGGISSTVGPDDQDAVAELLGISAASGWTAADRLMRRLHRIGAQLEWAAETELQRAARAVGAPGPEPEPLAVEPSWPPEEWIEAFAEVAEHGGWVRLPTRRWVRPATEPLAWSPVMVAGFIRILASGDGGARALEMMSVAGLMRTLMPEWDDVDWRPQRDPYHRYPVGVHLIQTAAQAAKLLHRPDEPFAAEATAQVSDPAPVLLGALLHDIGKVGRGSHVPAGTQIARRVLERMDVGASVRDDVLFLVAEHLVLSDTATRRDLDDRRLIADVAARIGAPGRLAMLYLLTVADAYATGPAAATPWRMGLVRDLVSKVSQVLEGASAAAEPPGRPGPGNVDVAAPRPGAAEVRTHLLAGRAPGTFALTVVALDRPGLLSRIAGALTLSGLSILSAQAFTTDDGIAIDAFEVGPAFNEEIEEERWRRFRTTLRHAIEGRIDVRDRIERLREHYRPARTDLPVSVRVDQDASSSFTVVEVGAPDRMGLLFDLARTLSAHGLDVHLAKVATYGPRVVDAFYVTDAAGSKLTDPDRAAELERALAEISRP